MTVDFKHDEGDIIHLKIDPNKTPFMITALIYKNGGQFYRIWDGGDSELDRAHYEIEKITESKRDKVQGFANRKSQT